MEEDGGRKIKEEREEKEEKGRKKGGNLTSLI